MKLTFCLFKINPLHPRCYASFLGVMLLMMMSTAHAQTPGNVSAGLRFWLKANGGTTTTGVDVTGWTDQSPAATPVTVTGSPDLVNAGYNFNPYVNFTLSSPTGGDYLRIPDNNFQTFFWVAQLANTSRAATHLATYDGVTTSLPCALCPIHGGSNGGAVAQYHELGYGRAAFQAAGSWRRNGNPTPYNTPHSGRYDIVSALGSTVVPTNVFLGGQTTATWFNGRVRDWLGPVGEVIAYSGSVTIAEANQVESYLAIKYGITLGNNASINTAYTSPTGVTLWAQNTGYHYDVAGIGKDMVLEGLDQPKSRSINTPSDVVSMANSNYTAPVSLTADGQYLIWGHNNGSVTALSTCQNFIHLAPATTITAVWGRTWRTQKTGNPTGNAIIEIDMAAYQGPTGLGSNANADMRLLIDDNTAFGDASPGESTYAPNAGYTAQGGKLYFTVPYSSIQNGTGFFTLGTSGVIADINAEPSLTFCAGTVVPINTFTGTAAGTTFNWTNSNPAIGLAASGTGDLPSFTALNGTAAPISGVITVTPGVLCPGTPISFSITVDPSVTPSVAVSASQTSICAGTTVTFTATPVHVGSNPNYQWLINGINAAAGTMTFSSSTLQNGDVISFTYTTDAACATTSLAASAGVTITVLGTTPTMNPVPSLTVCAGTAIPLNTFTSNVAGTIFNWTNSNPAIGLAANGTGDVPSFTGLNTTNAPIMGIVTVTPGVACPGAAETFSITIDPSPVPAVSISASQTTICVGTAVSFTANPSNGGANPAYQWLLNGLSTGSGSTNFSSSSLQNGDVIGFTFTSSAACATPSISAANTITLSVNQIPIASFTFSPSEPTTENPLVQFIDLSTFASQWLWDFHGLSSSSINNPGYLFPGAGTYSVFLTVTNGPCSATVTHTLYVESASSYYIPNSFTPNGDNLNDDFKMAGTGISSEDFEFSIFDRWGTLIFKTNDLQKGWDGTCRGKHVPNDVYVYSINFKMKENKEFISKTGHVSVLR